MLRAIEATREQRSRNHDDIWPAKIGGGDPRPFRRKRIALVAFSMLLFLLSGYLAFNRYWIRTRWTKAEATALSGEIRQLSTSRIGSGTSSKSYFFHCTVRYPVAGEIRQSQLDSPPSPYRMDAQMWAAGWSPDRHIAIVYKPSNPSEIRLVDNPAELTAMGSLRMALYLFIPGTLLILTSRSGRVDYR